MRIPFGKTFPLVSRSRSSVKIKVKYQGHITKKKKNGLFMGLSVCYPPPVGGGDIILALFVCMRRFLSGLVQAITPIFTNGFQ